MFEEEAIENDREGGTDKIKRTKAKYTRRRRGKNCRVSVGVK